MPLCRLRLKIRIHSEFQLSSSSTLEGDVITGQDTVGHVLIDSARYTDLEYIYLLFVFANILTKT